MNNYKIIINFFPLFLVLFIILSINGNSISAQDSYNFAEIFDHVIISDSDEPVIKILRAITIDSDNLIVIAYLTHISSYLNYNSKDNLDLLWNYSYGLHQNAHIWDAVLTQSESEIILSLSNGTVFSIDQNGDIIWKNNLDNSEISKLTLLSSNVLTAISNNNLYWLSPSNGTLLSNYTISNTITLQKSNNNDTILGDENGSIYFFNNFEFKWKLNIGSSSVTSLLIDELIIANSFNYDTYFVDLNGNIMNTENFGQLVFNSFSLINNNLYVSLINGNLLSFSLSNFEELWIVENIFATNVIQTEFSGDMIEDLAIVSNSGNIFCLDKEYGIIKYKDSVSESNIVTPIILELNDNNISDLIIGTRNGEIIVYLGKDVTAPKIEALSYDFTHNSIEINFSTDELTSFSIKYGEYQDYETDLNFINETLSKNHFLSILNLDPEVEYYFEITIFDKFNNVNYSEKIYFQTNSAPLPILEFFFAGIAILSLIGGSAYYFNEKRNRKKAYIIAENQYQAGQYIPAIKSFYKAKSKERIIEIVTFLADNPQLSSYVDEIKQLEELNEYIEDIQTIINR